MRLGWRTIGPAELRCLGVMPGQQGRPATTRFWALHVLHLPRCGLSVGDGAWRIWLRVRFKLVLDSGEVHFWWMGLGLEGLCARESRLGTGGKAQPTRPLECRHLKARRGQGKTLGKGA